jgi:hypothetical protein
MAPKDPIRSSTVPTAQLIEIKESIARIVVGVEHITDKQLPPVAKDAKEARDGMIKLTGWNRDMSRRLKKVEETPPSHACLHEERIDGHGNAITAHEKQIAGLGSGRKAAVTIGIFAVGIALTFAGKAIWDSSASTTNITNIQQDVGRHEAMIKAMESHRQADRTEIITAVDRVPDKVKAAVKTEVVRVDDLPYSEHLTLSERRQVEYVFERAKARGDR